MTTAEGVIIGVLLLIIFLGLISNVRRLEFKVWTLLADNGHLRSTLAKYERERRMGADNITEVAFKKETKEK